MALNKESVKIVCNAFDDIFDCPYIEKNDKKADGGYESIAIHVDEIRNWQIKDLVKAVEKVGNTWYLKPDEGKIRIAFF